MTWACLRYVQGLANILGPQNRTQGRCELIFAKRNAQIQKFMGKKVGKKLLKLKVYRYTGGPLVAL